jgi:hypothetical protein
MIPPESLSISLSTFTLIALAEVGDKSQLVCMTLAARHRHWPVILGATTAFLVLNTLAVLFGAGNGLGTRCLGRTHGVTAPSASLAAPDKRRGVSAVRHTGGLASTCLR